MNDYPDNPGSLEEEMKRAQEIAEEIEHIKTKDPEGWAKAELSTAIEYAVDCVANIGIPEKISFQEAIDLYHKNLKANHIQQIRSCKSLAEVQGYIDQYGVPEMPDFEGAVLDMYQIASDFED